MRTFTKTLGLDEVIDHAKQNGGGTYQLAGLDSNGYISFIMPEHTFGYYVSLPYGIENLPSRALITPVLASFVADRKDGNYLGLWEDAQGNWSIDISTWVYDLRAALVLGARHNQRAIWDIENMREIMLSTGDHETPTPDNLITESFAPSPVPTPISSYTD